jgi:hypothetical protein
MNLNTYNLCEDWGWYVDTESNYKDIENLQLEYNYKENGIKIEVEFDKSENTNLYKIGSTTLITALLIYAIFFLI